MEIGIRMQIGVLLLAGVLILAWAGRRRFLRRDILGVQRFRSYGEMVFASTVDAMALGVGWACLAGAGALAIMEYASMWALLAAIVALSAISERCRTR